MKRTARAKGRLGASLWIVGGLLLGALVVAVTLDARVGAREREARELSEDALQALYAGRYDDALAGWTRASELDPDYGRAHLGVGQAYAALGKLEHALEPLRRAIELLESKELLSAAYGTRGYVHVSMQRNREAVEDLDRGIELWPEHGRLYYDRALANWRLGNKDGVRADLERARSMEPELPGVYLGLGILELEAGRPQRALELLLQGRERGPAGVVAQDIEARLAEARAALE